MKKKRLLICGLISALCFSTFASCNKKLNNPPTMTHILSTLSSRYSKPFILLEDNTKDDGTGTLTFEDTNGVQFTVYISKDTIGEFMPDYRYRTSERYIPAYYNAHPELFEPFKVNGHDFKNEDSSHNMYYHSFDEIDETVRFTCKTAYNMERICNSVSDSDISHSSAYINFVPADCSGISEHKQYSYISIPATEESHCMSEEEIQNLISEIQLDYVETLRELNDTEKLSELTYEQIMLAPLPEIHNVTLNDKVVFSTMKDYYPASNYLEGDDTGYCYTFQIKRASDPDSIFTHQSFFEEMGWEYSNDGSDISFTKGDMSLVYHIERFITTDYNGNLKYEFEAVPELNGETCYYIENCRTSNNTLNGKDFDFQFTLNEKAFREIFGVEFEFDQVNGTGKIVKYGN